MTDREHLESLSLSELANYMSGGGANSMNAHWARVEFLRRQTSAQVQASEAAKATAEKTAQYTGYMLVSVVVLAVSASASLLVEIVRLALGH